MEWAQMLALSLRRKAALQQPNNSIDANAANACRAVRAVRALGSGAYLSRHRPPFWHNVPPGGASFLGAQQHRPTI